MAKRKFKINYEGLEITGKEIDDFKPLIDLLTTASAWERQNHHLKNCENYEKLVDKIFDDLRSQI